MAHIGQKISLGPVGFVGRPLGLHQFFSHALTLGNVFLDGYKISELTFFVADRRYTCMLPEQFTVFLFIVKFSVPFIARQDGIPQILEVPTRQFTGI